MKKLLHLLEITACLLLHCSVSGEHLHQKNICPKTVKYQERTLVPVTDIIKEYYKTWCFAIPPRCTTFRYKIVQLNRTIIMHKTKIVNECCKGYEKVKESCEPICRGGCGHGKCIMPDVCLCDIGWKKPNCKISCDRNIFDADCWDENCLCKNGGTCNYMNGDCYCLEGFIGKYCELSCPNGRYGVNCQHLCKCQNAALCDIKDGTCECQPGYFGEYCENKCEPGTHGENCEKACDCFNDTTEFCNHIDGKCVCKPGWKGEFCEEKCNNLTYGPRCASRCDCVNSDFCDHITGKCICKVGWIGERCSEGCPDGNFGEECLLLCNCPSKYIGCNHVTGSCVCPPGKTGEHCEQTCDNSSWGMNCSETCKCTKSMKCNPETGECSCLPGWMGDDCSEPCDNSSWGTNCSETCKCPTSMKCNSETGECSCWPGWMGEDCSESCPCGFYGMNCSEKCNCSGNEPCDPSDGTCPCMPDKNNCDEYFDNYFRTYENREVKVLVYYFSSLALVGVCVYFICCSKCCAPFLRRIKSKKLKLTRKRELFYPYFENPDYFVHNVAKVNNELQTDNVSDPDSSTASTDGLQRVVSYLDSIRDSLSLANSSAGSANEAGEQKEDRKKKCNSSLRKSTLNDLSAVEGRSSNIYGTVKETNLHSSYSASEVEEDYEPEKLCEFNILEDSLYQSIKYSVPSELEKMQNPEKKESK